MKQWKQVSAVAAAVMALASGGVHALGLGVPNSRAVLGESLRMSVPLELEAGEDTDDGCPQAEVVYGDSRLDAGQVILGVSPQTGRHRVVSVRAIQPINEPLIEVTLSYGCGARLSRKFTVFASPPEFVPTVVLSPATISAVAEGEGERQGGAVAAPSTPVTPRAATRTTEVARDPAALPRAVRPVPVRRPVSPTASAPRPKAPPVAPPLPVRAAEPVAAPVSGAVPASVPAPAVQPAPAAPAPKASSVVMRKPAPAPKVAPVSRLVLDPVVIPVAASMPGAGVSAAASGVQPNLVTSQAGTDLDRLQAQMAQDRQRLDEMEKLVTQLRQEAAQAAASGVGLERPIGLTDARHPVWLLAVSGVAALSLLFSGYLFLRLRRQEQSRAWWTDSGR